MRFKETTLPPNTLGAAIDKSGRVYIDTAKIADVEPVYYPALMLHEAYHVLLRHFQRARRISADSRLWNIAADMEINAGLAREGWKLPKNVIHPRQFDLPDNLLAEQYYDLLKRNEYKPNRREGCDDDGLPNIDAGSGSDGIAKEWETEPEALSPVEIDAIRRNVANAYVQSKKPGKQSVLMDRVVEFYLDQRIDWRRVLMSAIRRSIALSLVWSNSTYARPSRRDLPDIITPGRQGEKPSVGVIVDTSASMSKQELELALAQVWALLRQYGDSLHIYVADADVAWKGKTNSVHRIQVIGGGGTDMGKAIDQMAEEVRPDTIIVLTDGETPWPAKPPASRVVVGLIKPTKEAVGEVPDYMTKVIVE